MQLYNLTTQDTGLYSCRVTNQYGGAVATGSITVTELDTAVHTEGISLGSGIVAQVFEK